MGNVNRNSSHHGERGRERGEQRERDGDGRRTRDGRAGNED